MNQARGVPLLTRRPTVPRPRKPADDDEADPLIPPAEFARLCGHSDTTTISHWVSGKQRPPEGWPAPDEWEELPSRRRPLWRRSRAEQFAAAARSPGVRPGQFHGRRPSPTPDPRAVEVAGWLAAAEAGTREPVTRQEVEDVYDVPDYTARRILTRARSHRDQQ